MDPIQDAHAKLFAREFLNLAAGPSPSSFSIDSGRVVTRAEAVGVVVSRERRNNFLRFLLDDGTGCIPCVLWLNHRRLFLSAQRPSPDTELLARAAEGDAARAEMGALVRVRGRITAFRGVVELTVSGVAAERDPNAEALHWLQCLRLARCCYGRHGPPPPLLQPICAAAAKTKKRKTPPLS